MQLAHGAKCWGLVINSSLTSGLTRRVCWNSVSEEAVHDASADLTREYPHVGKLAVER